MKPQPVGRHARAEAAVVALDQRDHVAGGIRHGHVDGVALIEGLGVGGIFERGPVQLDERAALRRIVLRDQPLERNLRELRIGVELRAVFEGELLGLDEDVQIVGAAETHGLEVVGLEDVEHLQRGDALRVRRQLPHVVAAVVSGHGLDPLGAVRGQIGGGEIPAVGAHVGLRCAWRCRLCRTRRARLRRSR